MPLNSSSGLKYCVDLMYSYKCTTEQLFCLCQCYSSALSDHLSMLVDEEQRSSWSNHWDICCVSDYMGVRGKLVLQSSLRAESLFKGFTTASLFQAVHINKLGHLHCTQAATITIPAEWGSIHCVQGVIITSGFCP